jgi:acetyl-CoA carboxylase biotin carboxyl carrier protein
MLSFGETATSAPRNQQRDRALPMPISLDSVIDQIEWAAANGLSTLSLRLEGATLTLKRACGSPPIAPIHQPTAPAAPVTAVLAEVDLAEVITASVAGLCLLSSEQGGKAFVSLGDRVEAGQTLCMIEAMKVMIPVTASKAGRVAEILIADNTTIAAGAAIMRLI